MHRRNKRFLNPHIAKFIAFLLLLIPIFTWLSLSEAVIDPQVSPEITVYRPNDLNTPVVNKTSAYPYYQAQTLKLDLDINPVLSSASLTPTSVETVYADFSAVGGPGQFFLTDKQSGVYNLEYPLINLVQTGNFIVSFHGNLADGGLINLGSFMVYANKQNPTALNGPQGAKTLQVMPQFTSVQDFSAVSGVYLEVPERGKITFSSPVDLVNGGIMDNPDKLNSGLLLYNPNQAGINSQQLPGLNVPAQIEIYGVHLAQGIDRPNIIQLDDTGKQVYPASNLKNETVTYNETTGTVSFEVYGFSSYAIDPGLQVITESHLIETDRVTIEGYVQDLSTRVSIFVYQEDNPAGQPLIDPVTGHFTFELTNLVDGINPVWIKADNGAITTTWDAKPKSTAVEPLQILVNTNGIIEAGLSTENTDIIVKPPATPGVTGRDINTFNRTKVEFYGQAAPDYWSTVYYQSQPLATGKVGTVTDGVFMVPVLDLSTLPEGNLNFTLKCFDPKGYESTPVFDTFFKDTIPPTEQPLVLNPANNYTTSDSQPTFSGTLPPDTAGDVGDVRLYNGSGLISVGAVNLADKTWFVRPALPLTPGSYDLYLVLGDKSGNESSATPLPTINILNPQVRTRP